MQPCIIVADILETAHYSTMWNFKVWFANVLSKRAKNNEKAKNISDDQSMNVTPVLHMTGVFVNIDDANTGSDSDSDEIEFSKSGANKNDTMPVFTKAKSVGGEEANVATTSDRYTTAAVMGDNKGKENVFCGLNSKGVVGEVSNRTVLEDKNANA